MSRFGIFVNQGGDTVKGVKEKVWVQLSLEHLQTGLCQMSFQLDGPPFPFPISIVIIERIPGADNCGVGEHILVKMVCKDQFKQTWPGKSRMQDLGLDPSSSSQHATMKKGSH